MKNRRGLFGQVTAVSTWDKIKNKRILEEQCDIFRILLQQETSKGNLPALKTVFVFEKTTKIYIVFL